MIPGWQSLPGGSRLKNLLPTGFLGRIFRMRTGGLLQAGVLLLSFLLFCLGIGIKSMPARAAPKTETLWGISQECDSEIADPDNSIDGPKAGFDGKTASCALGTGEENSAWKMDSFERPGLGKFNKVRLEIGFYVSTWSEKDVLSLQASSDGGKNWIDLEKYDRSNPAPRKLTYQEVDAADVFHSLESIRKAQVRLVNLDRGQNKASILIYLDGMRLVGTRENVVPTFKPTATKAPDATNTPTKPIGTPTESIVPTSTPIPIASEVTETVAATSTPAAPATQTTGTATLPGTIPTTPVPSLTQTATVTPTPTPTPTPQPVIDNTNGGQVLWLVDQACNFPIEHPENSLDRNFNNQMASCSGDFAGKQAGWQFLAFQHTSFTHIDDTRLDLRLSVSGWVDDQIDLEVSDGAQWQQVAQFDPDHTVPPAGITTLSYSLARFLQSTEKINQVKIRLIGVKTNLTVDPMTINIDEARLVVSGGIASVQAVGPIPTPSRLTRAVIGAPGSGDPHGDHTATTDSCAACHLSHTGQGSVLRPSWPEETVCFGCHSTAGPGTSVQPAFSKNLNSATRYLSHPVNGTNDVHRLGESSGSSFGGGNRHIECEDCHEPHNAGRGSSAAPALQAEMTGISGVDPVWTGPGGPASYTWLTSATREYQVCFKCHSSFTTLPAYAPDGWNGSAYVANGLRKLTSGNAQQVLDSRNLAKEFNPYQASFHPVAAQGRNTNIPAGSFVSGWNQNSLVYCTDCHTNADPNAGGSGPHGSPLLHLLNGGSNYSTVMQNAAPKVPSTQICFTCHNYATYVTGQNQFTHFRLHSQHMNNDWGTTCYTCHDSHGSEQLHLINIDASVATFLNNRNSQTAWYYDPVTQRAGCFVSCHGETHDPKEYTP